MTDPSTFFRIVETPLDEEHFMCEVGVYKIYWRNREEPEDPYSVVALHPDFKPGDFLPRGLSYVSYEDAYTNLLAEIAG